MTDKVEQVAQAIWDAGCREDHDVRCSFARAAIEAVCKVIIQAVRDAPALDEIGYIATKHVILREIDAALKGDA